ncbi:MAG: MotA/TolQ/ExbB proton channel family protein [Myxococcota bacterium]|nr:MotA/TolQ/ExbB proton channel family protein [Myxococcota bacterium]
MSDFIQFLGSGGPVMAPIGLASVVGLAVFLERAVALRRAGVVPADFAREAVELLRQGRPADALTAARKREAAAARVVATALEARGQTRPVIKERLEEVGRREAAELERNAPIIGTVASISPLMGLLGTVWGMIQTFEVIQTQGVGVVGSLAGGISQALITTMAGLSVGIPALIAYRWVLARVDALVLELEEVGLEVLDLVAAPATGVDGDGEPT